MSSAKKFFEYKYPNPKKDKRERTRAVKVVEMINILEDRTGKDVLAFDSHDLRDLAFIFLCSKFVRREPIKKATRQFIWDLSLYNKKTGLNLMSALQNNEFWMDEPYGYDLENPFITTEEFYRRVDKLMNPTDRFLLLAGFENASLEKQGIDVFTLKAENVHDGMFEFEGGRVYIPSKELYQAAIDSINEEYYLLRPFEYKRSAARNTESPYVVFMESRENPTEKQVIDSARRKMEDALILIGLPNLNKLSGIREIHRLRGLAALNAANQYVALMDRLKIPFDRAYESKPGKQLKDEFFIYARHQSGLTRIRYGNVETMINKLLENRKKTKEQEG